MLNYIWRCNFLVQITSIEIQWDSSILLACAPLDLCRFGMSNFLHPNYIYGMNFPGVFVCIGYHFWGIILLWLYVYNKYTTVWIFVSDSWCLYHIVGILYSFFFQHSWIFSSSCIIFLSGLVYDSSTMMRRLHSKNFNCIR